MLRTSLHSLVVGLVRRTWLVVAVTVVVCSAFAAHALAALTAPNAVVTPGRVLPARPAIAPRRIPDGAGLVERNMFCSTCGPALLPGSTDASSPGRLAVLISTTFGPDATATVRVPETEVQGSWGLGERIPGVGTIERIGFASIDLVDGAGTRRTLSLHGSEAAGRGETGAATPSTSPADPFANRVKQTGDHAYDVDRDLVRELVSGATKAGKMRMVPIVTNGEVKGVRVLGVQPGSAPAAIGLRSGDLLDAIDGDKLTTAQQLLDLYGKLDQLSTVTLQGTRGGKPLAIALRLR